MQNDLTITHGSVHLWRVSVPDLLAQVDVFSRILDADEMQRAMRFHFEEHRNRFIITRAILRLILSLYTEIKPTDIIFTQGSRGKPYLRDNPHHLQFNVSHSHEMAIYALTMQTEIGVDIEKISSAFSEGVATRFFSQQEQKELFALPEREQAAIFYHIWAGKEAIIKALGEGLFASLSEFSLDLKKKIQYIHFLHEQKEYHYHVEYFPAHKDYQSAFATAQPITSIQYRQWTPHGPGMWR